VPSLQKMTSLWVREPLFLTLVSSAKKANWSHVSAIEVMAASITEHLSLFAFHSPGSAGRYREFHVE
jgi:hypothetical protein